MTFHVNKQFLDATTYSIGLYYSDTNGPQNNKSNHVRSCAYDIGGKLYGKVVPPLSLLNLYYKIYIKNALKSVKIYNIVH